MNLELLDIRNPAVLEFLWRYLVPTDLRSDYNRLDAIKEVERQVQCGDCLLLGDMEANLVMRVAVRNAKVVEPHIMGDGSKIRSATDLGIDLAWELGYEKVAIYTQHDKIARIVERLGFKKVALVPGLHMGEGGQLLDIHILTMEKPHAL